MKRIGMFFGTETGTTRLIAKKMQKLLGDEIADKPVNVNRIDTAQMLAYDALIIGTPSYGVGEIPGRSAGCIESNWAEFVDQLGDADFSGKRIAMFGLGAQERYSERFASSLIALHRVFSERGAEMIGDWPIDDYTFEYSASVVDGRFVGLVIDQRTQGMLTDQRIAQWLDQIRQQLLERIDLVAAEVQNVAVGAA